jgi:hypothetical protein
MEEDLHVRPGLALAGDLPGRAGDLVAHGERLERADADVAEVRAVADAGHEATAGKRLADRHTLGREGGTIAVGECLVRVEDHGPSQAGARIVTLARLLILGEGGRGYEKNEKDGRQSAHGGFIDPRSEY